VNKILTITPSLYGGAGNFITSLLCFTQNIGYKNTLISSRLKNQYIDWTNYIDILKKEGVKNLQLDFFHRESSIFWINCEKLVDIIKTNDFSLIHTHSALPTLAARIALEITKKTIPILTTFYSFGLDRPKWMDFEDYYSFDKADRITTISNYCKDLLFKNGIPESKIELIPIGIDIDEIEANKGNRHKTRSKISVSDKDILLIQVAAIEPRKNQTMSLKILECLKGEKDRKYKLILVGDKKDDFYFQEMKNYIEKKNLWDDVIFTGLVDNSYKYLFASDIFIFPTLSEGLGLAILEAMAAKIPVFSTYIEGTKDILIDEVNSKVISIDNPMEAADSILDLLKSRDTIDKFCTNAYNIVHDKFVISRTLQRYMQIYMELI